MAKRNEASDSMYCPLDITGENGIFPDLVNKAAFADKVVLGVWRTELAEPGKHVIVGPSRPIAGPECLY